MNVQGLFGCKVVTSKYLPDDWIVLMNEVHNERGELEPRLILFVVEPGLTGSTPRKGNPNFHDGPHPAKPGACARCDMLEDWNVAGIGQE